MSTTSAPAKVRHRWEIDVLPAEPEAPLTLWRNGEYVAHLDAAAAEAVADLLRARAGALSAVESTL